MNVHAEGHPMRVFRTKPLKAPINDQSCWHCKRSASTPVFTEIDCPKLGLCNVNPDTARTCDDFMDSRRTAPLPPGQEARR